MISMEAWVTIRYLRAQGKSIKGIARELGISKNTVKRALKANKPPHYQRPPRDNPLSRAADLIYSDARCGFFHDGCFRSRILVSPDASHDLIITLPKKNGIIDKQGDIESIIINPNLILSAIESHFEHYLRKVRDMSNKEIRANFENACKIKWALDEPPVVIGLDPDNINNS
ncbi:MAG: hypothetical protein KIIPBIDF_01572 [Candidatus Methanoperedenaceae archaeon GB50]|nr:MAG: hypothetical protein KIIPBIDF_01235 [Candidatus Methanoperedenaceae archaeon GB50]CAD7779814.1 MAG: hypothetical protein KIIPBIDF_01236 [Candidatus Methanoperedenaceae archaeon GB50]CAD7782033.1 MAG: hypothetical protein KIIPBIDF_01572 [Candidatus Methanoperedenaceae archaeon GB50]